MLSGEAQCRDDGSAIYSVETRFDFSCSKPQMPRDASLNDFSVRHEEVSHLFNDQASKSVKVSFKNFIRSQTMRF